ncbi:CBASS cGAMP synthase [uncultured Brevundimonas sp.]|uniref:CBASS cGAMP synthase n=1 Tax=uncultured Brevundimonas sp. TaxID=213418 RepID=UPI0025D9405F|nr:CBASS cGAMP synthase [uncultured Brevundimonas sp.]
MRVQHLFHSADVERQTLHRRITPTAVQRAQQQVRWQDVCDYLIDDLSEKSGYAISSWLQGSYKFGTQIRPAKLGDEFDIDLGIYFHWQGDAGATGEDPRALKALVQQSLHDYAVEAEDDVEEVVDPPKERCSRVRFSGDFHIDVPSYHLDEGRDARDLATETNGWEESDPKALYVWFHRLFADDDTAQVRRLTRYMKMWAALKLSERPASVLLTVLVAEAYIGLTAAEIETDDFALRNVAATILDRMTGSAEVENPAIRRENLNRMSPVATEDFLAGLRTLIDIADGADNAATEAEAAFWWTEAFDHFFPAPTQQRAEGGGLVPVAFDPQVSVEARPEGSPAVMRGLNSIGPIPKKSAVTFTLDNARLLPAGAQVRWFVRNEGEEAELVNDMGHVSQVGPTAREDSAYRGTHYMDVVAVSALGGVLGFRRVPVQVSGMVMPPRNPKRPGYRRHGARR